MDESPQSKGGKGRAKTLSPVQRSEIAAKGAAARWARFAIPEGQKLNKAVAYGVLHIGEASLQCAVLDDEHNTRVLTQTGFQSALGRAPKPTKSDPLVEDLPTFLQAKNLKPFLTNDLRWSTIPIIFETKSGGGFQGRALGYKAQLLPDVCWVYHNAHIAGKILPSQKHIAEKCTILLRALTNVAIDALVDEATGWQYKREKNELQKLLSAYISSELLPWAERFPSDFYKEMFRLWGWQWPPAAGDKSGPLGPRYAGKLTNKLVYDQLPAPVTAELKSKSPPNDKWQRANRLHQHLSEDIGQPHLEKQVAVSTNIMKVCDDKEEFQQKFEKAFPGSFDKGRQLSFTRALKKPDE